MGLRCRGVEGAVRTGPLEWEGKLGCHLVEAGNVGGLGFGSVSQRDGFFNRGHEVEEEGGKDTVNRTVFGEAKLEVFDVLFGSVEAEFFERDRLKFVGVLDFVLH